MMSNLSPPVRTAKTMVSASRMPTWACDPGCDVHTREGRTRRLTPMVSLAASIALILGLGVAFNEAMKPEPCVTFACQLEAMSDEELAEMMKLMEEESVLDLEAESWSTLY